MAFIRRIILFLGYDSGLLKLQSVNRKPLQDSKTRNQIACCVERSNIRKDLECSLDLRNYQPKINKRKHFCTNR